MQASMTYPFGSRHTSSPAHSQAEGGAEFFGGKTSSRPDHAGWGFVFARL
jgi:hypothetical protein